MGRVLKWTLFVVAGVILGSWGGALALLPPANPEPHYKGVVLSTAADRILRDSCFDCHSNETRYEWYHYAPIAAQLVARDVIKGRKELNFSAWDGLFETRRTRKLKEMREQIESGEMPPWYYTLPNPHAKLSPQAKQRLLSDLAAAGAAGGSGGKAESRGDEREHDRKAEGRAAEPEHDRKPAEKKAH